MNFAAALADASTPYMRRCGVAKIRDALTDDDLAALNTAMGDHAVASAHIAKALATIGHQISGSTLRRHRRGECLCA